MVHLQAIRMKQWPNNVLTFLPMLAAHQFLNGGAWRYELYRRPEDLWLLALAYWIARTWLRAVRGEMERGLWVRLGADRGGYLASGAALLICYFAV